MKRKPLPISVAEWREAVVAVGAVGVSKPIDAKWDHKAAACHMTALVKEHQESTGLAVTPYEQRVGLSGVLMQVKGRGTCLSIPVVARIAQTYDVPLACFVWPLEPDPTRRAALKALGEAGEA